MNPTKKHFTLPAGRSVAKLLFRLKCLAIRNGWLRVFLENDIINLKFKKKEITNMAKSQESRKESKKKPMKTAKEKKMAKMEKKRNK